MSQGPLPRDRRQLLLEAPGALLSGLDLNGIDYVDVAPSQTQLFVHFLNPVTVQGHLSGKHPVTITGGEVITNITVNPIDEATDWSADSEGRPVLTLTVTAAGDFSTYLLTIPSDRLDPFFRQVPFTFKANCPSTLDCAAPAPSCPEPAAEQVSIDYLAKDFASFQQALSEFSALRYPAWVERSEADLGVVLMEALAAMADELSYFQDRVSAESTIETATQRLSVVRHARLVDYEPAPATVATTVLQLDVPTSWTIDTRLPVLVRALGADGSVVDFEIEDPAVGLAGSVSVSAAPPPWAKLDTRWNRASLRAYYWDDSQRCLPEGSTDFYLIGHGIGLYCGQQLLLDSPAADSADPPVRELVTVAETKRRHDPLLGDPLLGGPPPLPLTQVCLQAATTEDHDLYDTAVAGNIVPAVQGLRHSGETFLIPDPTKPPPGPVVVRAGANWTPQDPLPDYRYCLASGPLAWLATAGQDEDTSVPAQPEIVLSETGGTWGFERWLLGAEAADQVFTLTPEQYSPVLTSGPTTWFDYDGDGGTTIRFGDGTFGMSPPPGTNFSVLYRVGGGFLGNVPADTIVSVAPEQMQVVSINTCTNPFPATGGADAETIPQVRDRAPQKFSAEPLRLVAGRGLRGGGAVAAVGAAGRHHVPLDGQLAHRAHQRRSRRKRGADDHPAAVAHRVARPAAAGRLRELRPSAELRVDRSADHGVRAGCLLRQRRGGRRARFAAARAPPRRCGRVLRPLPLGLRRAAGVERAARRDPVVPRRRRRVPGPVPRTRCPAGLGAPARYAHVRLRRDPAHRQ